MTIKGCLLISLFFMCTEAANAASANFTTAAVYLSTKEACLNLPAETLRGSSLLHDQLRAGYFPSKNFNKLLTAIRQEGFTLGFQLSVSDASVYASGLLRNEGFQKALRECYSMAPEAEDFFVESVKRSERAGKILGSAAILATLQAGTKVFTTAAFKIKKWTGVSLESFSKIYHVMTGALLASALTSDTTRPEPELSFDDLTASLQKMETNHLTEDAYRVSLGALIRHYENEVQKLQQDQSAEKNPVVGKKIQDQIDRNKNQIQELKAELL